MCKPFLISCGESLVTCTDPKCIPKSSQTFELFVKPFLMQVYSIYSKLRLGMLSLGLVVGLLDYVRRFMSNDP